MYRTQAKEYIVICFLCVLCIFTEGHAPGRIRPSTYNLSDAVFTITFDGWNKNDSLRILFFRNQINGSGTLDEIRLTGSERLIVHPKSNGQFNFILKNVSHYGKLDLVLWRGKKAYQVNNGYWVVAGDNVSVKLDELDNEVWATFYGKGSRKYTCCDSLCFPYHSVEAKRNMTTRYLFQGDEQLTDSIINGDIKIQNQAISILNFFKKQVEYKAFLLMRTQWIYVTEGDILFRKWLVLTPDSAKYSLEYRRKIKKVYEDLNVNIPDTTNSFLMSLSGEYLDYLILNTVLKLESKLNGSPNIFEILEFMRNSYRGRLLDRLVGDCLLDWRRRAYIIYKTNEFDSAMLMAKAFVKTRYIMEALQLRLIYQKGHDAFVFNLEDSSGKMVSLNDFRGKVILMDCWYTGCTGCAEFYQSYLKDSIELYFSTNPNFVIISIGTDSKKTTWLKSIYKKEYTSPSDMNLYSGSISNSAMLQYYHVDSMPFILLIDKRGKIIGRVINFEKIREIRNMIDEALM